MLVPKSISSTFFSCRQTNKKTNSAFKLGSEAMPLFCSRRTFHLETLLLHRGRMNETHKADIAGGRVLQDARRTLNSHSNQHSNSWEMCLLCSRFIILLCTNNSPTSPSKPRKNWERSTGTFSLFEKQNSRPLPPSFATAKHTSEHALDPICSAMRNRHSI